MATFPQVGVSAVVQNAQQYGAALQQMAAQTTAAGNQIKAAASNTQAMDSATKGALGTLQQFVPQIGQVNSAMSGLGDVFGLTGEQIAEIAIPVGVAVAALTAFFALAERGAGFSDIENGFAHLTAAAGVTADTLRTQLHNASEGTIDDITLMTITNQALLGVNAGLQKSFGQDLPQMMSIADTVAKATGQDTVSVFDSITEAIKRGQTRGLQAIGIVVDQKKAYDDYAKSMDISVKSMTKADQEQALLNATLAAGKQVTNELGDAQESNATRLEQAQTSITNILNNLSQAVQPIFGAILDGINGILSVISDAVSAVSPYIEALANLVTGGMDSMVSGGKKAISTIQQMKSAMEIVANTIKTLAANFFEGGANAIGALAGGITYAANTYVFPAVIGIANFIADFLSGLSPPPLGPLHTIDQGGANVMTAWIEGFTGVSLEPIQQVAADVNAAMGSVASMSLEQVKEQLLQLDDAIAPFQEQLDLVKNQFTMIDNVTKPALDAIDKQIALAQVALANGSTAAAAQIKTLDAQKQALTDYTDQQQIAVDNAQIQLALAQMQQSSQRDALLTQEQMLQQAASLTTKTTAPKGTKAPKQKGGKGAAVPVDDTGAPDLTPTADQTTAAQQAGIDLQTAYQQGFTGAAGDTGSAMFAANESQLKAAGNRISAAASNIGDQIDKALVQPFRDKLNSLGGVLDGLFGTGPNSIPTFIGKLPGAFADLGANLQTNLVDPISQKVQDAVAFFLPGNPKSLWTKIAKFATTDLPSALTGLGDNIDSSLVQPFVNKVTNLIASIDKFFNGSGDGTLPGIFDKVMTFLGGLPAKVSTALQSLARALVGHFVDPMVDALNGVLSGVSTFINNLISTINTAIAIYNNARTILPGNLPAVAPIYAIANFTPIPYPAVGAASGGMFGAGLLKVGERGPELVSSATPMGVFPNSFVEALDRLTSVINRPSAAMYNNTTYNNTQNLTFNGVATTEDAIRRFAQLQSVTAY